MTAESIPTETTGTSAPPQRRARRNVRPLIIGIVALVVLALVGRYGYDYYLDTTRYVSTDDALVDSNMVSVAPLAAGTLAVWQVKPGDTVRAGQVVGRLKTTTGSVYSNITAPIDGTILRVDGKEGQVVGQAQALAYVANLDAMRITAYIDESAIANVRAGQPVDVTVDATGDTVYSGTVSEVLSATAGTFALIPSSDRATGNFTKVSQRIEVHIDIGATGALRLYPGANAYVRILTK